MTITLETAANRIGMTIDPHLDVDEIMPVRTGPFAQGDLLCLPLDIKPPTGGVAVGPKGVPIIEGTHDHVLIADPGTCRWIAGAGKSTLSIGVVVADAPVHLLHAEHGGHCLAPGVWEMRGQREDSREGTRRVVD